MEGGSVRLNDLWVMVPPQERTTPPASCAGSVRQRAEGWLGLEPRFFGSGGAKAAEGRKVVSMSNLSNFPHIHLSKFGGFFSQYKVMLVPLTVMHSYHCKVSSSQIL